MKRALRFNLQSNFCKNLKRYCRNAQIANTKSLKNDIDIERSAVYCDENPDKNGFAVAENNDGKSSVQFSWIAIGKRKGFENRKLPAEVVAGDYTTKVQRGLHNDVDKTASGEGLYYQNGQLYNGNLPEPPQSDSEIKGPSDPKSVKNKADIAEVSSQKSTNSKVEGKDKK